MKCWIVCRPCDDSYYEGHATGVVFIDEAKAKAYIDGVNGPEDAEDPFWDWSALYLTEGEIQ